MIEESKLSTEDERKLLTNKQEFFITCECHTEGVHIVKDEHDGDIYISLWHFGTADLSWRNKLSWIWHILKGKPYPDYLIIGQERLQEIIDILITMKDKPS